MSTVKGDMPPPAVRQGRLENHPYRVSGDFLMVEPSKANGIVEQFGLRTTVIRHLNGDLAYVPNSQIITAIRPPRGYRRR